MSPAAHLLSIPIHLYRYLIAPLLRPSCRYLPTCSEYALEALARHGAMAGGWLALKRLLSCHPWGGSGHDPVPGNAPGHTRGQGQDAAQPGRAMDSA